MSRILSGEDTRCAQLRVCLPRGFAVEICGHMGLRTVAGGRRDVAQVRRG